MEVFLHCDCLILGGGPTASTIGALLRRYAPEFDVVIVEREKFPRDHIGESQLPAMMGILDEMGVYDKVEAQNFPIKVGSTYRWGVNKDFWNLSFLDEPLRDEPRPAPLAGQRLRLSFQVDRGIYDKVLLDHAASVGCTVLEQTKAQHIEREGDRVLWVDVVKIDEDGTQTDERITAKYYVDATGVSSLLRRAMGVEAEYPTRLKNIAFWDYWQDAKWAETIGCGGTRIQIMSIDWGWLWFIPITSTRTSIGVVTHAGYYKESGKTPEELYARAVREDSLIAELTKDATREYRLSATKDWSYVSERMYGENWFLAGDACGFADPILSAGLTLAQVSGRKVAYTILELEHREQDPAWLKDEFNRSHRFNILQHHRFAEFWYSSNGCCKDLKEYCSEIAHDAGITMGAEAAFYWMATGGFTAGNTPDVRGTGFGLTGISAIASKIFGTEANWKTMNANVFRLNLEGATEGVIGFYGLGKVTPTKCYQRGEKILPMTHANEHVLRALMLESDGECLYERFIAFIRSRGQRPAAVFFLLEALEAMVHEGWVTAEVDETRPLMPFEPITLFG